MKNVAAAPDGGEREGNLYLSANVFVGGDRGLLNKSCIIFLLEV